MLEATPAALRFFYFPTSLCLVSTCRHSVIHAVVDICKQPCDPLALSRIAPTLWRFFCFPASLCLISPCRHSFRRRCLQATVWSTRLVVHRTDALASLLLPHLPLSRFAMPVIRAVVDACKQPCGPLTLSHTAPTARPSPGAASVPKLSASPKLGSSARAVNDDEVVMPFSAGSRHNTGNWFPFPSMNPPPGTGYEVPMQASTNAINGELRLETVPSRPRRKSKEKETRIRSSSRYGNRAASKDLLDDLEAQLSGQYRSSSRRQTLNEVFATLRERMLQDASRLRDLEFRVEMLQTTNLRQTNTISQYEEELRKVRNDLTVTKCLLTEKEVQVTRAYDLVDLMKRELAEDKEQAARYRDQIRQLSTEALMAKGHSTGFSEGYDTGKLAAADYYTFVKTLTRQAQQRVRRRSGSVNTTTRRYEKPFFVSDSQRPKTTAPGQDSMRHASLSTDLSPASAVPAPLHTMTTSVGPHLAGAVIVAPRPRSKSQNVTQVASPGGVAIRPVPFALAVSPMKSPIPRITSRFVAPPGTSSLPVAPSTPPVAPQVLPVRPVYTHLSTTPHGYSEPVIPSIIAAPVSRTKHTRPPLSAATMAAPSATQAPVRPHSPSVISRGSTRLSEMDLLRDPTEQRPSGFSKCNLRMPTQSGAESVAPSSPESELSALPENDEHAYDPTGVDEWRHSTSTGRDNQSISSESSSSTASTPRSPTSTPRTTPATMATSGVLREGPPSDREHPSQQHPSGDQHYMLLDRPGSQQNVVPRRPTTGRKGTGGGMCSRRKPSSWLRDHFHRDSIPDAPDINIEPPSQSVTSSSSSSKFDPALLSEEAAAQPLPDTIVQEFVDAVQMQSTPWSGVPFHSATPQQSPVPANIMNLPDSQLPWSFVPQMQSPAYRPL
ncbi:hypothetical protein FISHEDRAFT_73273 [Fistulina hepatica ATCC 64428]|uniref:Uncharacterized protein n=1 Tax=Fistulina hepatica ATCC 64428 TaxID=1128425 RepID=A0A0D7ADQ4_9AGAR|nr:hypothetical protein FISHEDRAFT_73273 [Fistulina hepatica ATCC 64428]